MRQNRRVPDAIFDDPRLAQLYDPLDPDRSDLDVYADVVIELGAHSVLDVGCGTGTFACMLARRGIHVTAVDPARASLDVARAKPGAEAVDWLLGDATILPRLSVDAAFMTANVAQVFLTDDEWAATLRGLRGALRHHGVLVFETRDPRGSRVGTMDARADPDGGRRGRGGRGGVMGRGHRRRGSLRHVSVDDRVPARRRRARVDIDPALP